MSKLDLDTVQRYFDEESGSPLDLCFDNHKVELNGVVAYLESVPLLKNPNTGEIYYPNKTKDLLDYYTNKSFQDGDYEITLKPKERQVRYPYSEQFNFLYSHIDHEYIPGLIRPWDNGFLTPVFFNLAVLNKYTQHPDYKLELACESYGTVYCKDDWYISFGISESKKVIMWLGDIDKLPDNEKYYLRSENVESDHDIHSEFYDAQIDVKYSERSVLGEAIYQRNTTNELVKRIYNFDLYVLHGEVSEILANLDRPVFWEQKHVSPVMESLNRVFVESINAKEIRRNIKESGSGADSKSLKGNKLFQLWLSNVLNVHNADSLTCPFFVLYDFRIMCTHLLSEDKKKEVFSLICSRLELNQETASLEQLYNETLKRIVESYNKINESLTNE